MKSLIKLVQLFTLSIVTLFILVACNNGANSQASVINPNFTLSSTSTVTPILMKVGYSLDGQAVTNNMSNLKDMGWHVMTLTVESIPAGTSVPVEGVQAYIDGSSVGQPGPEGSMININDINCRSAVFTKAGDSCSVYVRFSYNYQQYGTAPLSIYVYFATDNYPLIPSIASFQTIIAAGMPISDTRQVLPIESAYWQASSLKAAPNQFQIIQIQNSSLEPINLTTITPLTNPQFFSLMNRNGAESNDPYYGNFPQCATTANPALNQLSTLSSLNQACILIYKANNIGVQATETDHVNLSTDAALQYPAYTGNFQFIATYAQNTPNIPSQALNGADMKVISGSAHAVGTSMVADSNGTVLNSGAITTSANFNQISIANDFIPNSLVLESVSYPSTLYVKYHNPVYPRGTPLIIAQADGTIQMPTVFMDLATTGGANGALINQTSCGNSSVDSVVVNVSASDYSTKQVLVNMQNSYNGISANFSGYVSTNSPTMQQLDSNQSSTSTWHQNMYGAYTSSCDSNNCTMTFSTYGAMYNLGWVNPCIGNNGQVILHFSFPSTNTIIGGAYSQSSFPVFVGVGGQGFSAQVGTASAAYSPSISLDTNYPPSVGRFVASGSYANGQSTNNSSFSITLNSGDTLIYSTVKFSPSSGYVLSSFNSMSTNSI